MFEYTRKITYRYANGDVKVYIHTYYGFKAIVERVKDWLHESD